MKGNLGVGQPPSIEHKDDSGGKILFTSISLHWLSLKTSSKNIRHENCSGSWGYNSEESAPSLSYFHCLEVTVLLLTVTIFLPAPPIRKILHLILAQGAPDLSAKRTTSKIWHSIEGRKKKLNIKFQHREVELKE